MLTLQLNKYKIICIVSMLALSAVQFFLLYKTYRLEDEHVYQAESGLIVQDYGKSIRNDKLFPGGEAIMNSYVYGNMDRLEQIYKTDRGRYDSLRLQLSQRIFAALRKANNMDSLLPAFVHKHKLKSKLDYALTIDLIELNFEGDSDVVLYDRRTDGPASGAIIGGKLRHFTPQNQIVHLTVSSDAAHSYRVTFNLYVDSATRQMDILTGMAPLFALSLLSIFAVILLFYLTYSKWVRQKKIADMKSDFINGITHEFHTPLSAIMVANKSLKTEGLLENKSKVGRLTDIIQRQSDRLKTLFEQVMNITSLQSLQLNRTGQSIGLLLDEIMLDYRLKLTDADVVLSFDHQAKQDLAEVDAFWFTTMVNNLLDNAIKYNRSPKKLITVKTGGDHRRLHLIIADNGVGIGEESRIYIFEKFYRGKENGVHSTGLGLGLYYVKLCVDAHRWSISVESEPGKGSRFMITIPL
ncbi:MAG: HAMP domain-containing histidine kinase [Bacteroidetes bacterium]|nr:HAMP domain-containing histidine kinase [Bacteroidota bacterium]